MDKNKNKEALIKSYEALKPFSENYKADFKRFLFSLNLLISRCELENKRILDIGSGIGIMAIALRSLSAEVFGVDKFIFPDEAENFYSIPDFENLKLAWKEHSFKVLKADIINEKIPFENDYFDIVICDATIEHLDKSPKALFGEAKRVLKSGGLFLVTTPNLATLLKRIRFLLGRSPNWDIKDYFESGLNFRGHRREFTVSELEKMLDWSLFKIIDKKTKNIFFNPKKILSRRKILSQFCGILSLPFFSMREMIYILAQKK